MIDYTLHQCTSKRRVVPRLHDGAREQAKAGAEHQVEQPERPRFLAVGPQSQGNYAVVGVSGHGSDEPGEIFGLIFPVAIHSHHDVVGS